MADANTKLFHIRVNGRRRKLLIQSLHTNEGIAITQDDKEKELHSHFQGHLGTVPPRTEGIDWAGLGYQPHDLSALEADFDDEEIKGVVFSLPSIKAPGPDGFIGAFFKACWETIKHDILAAIRLMSLGGGSYLNLINTANIILIPKKPDALSVSDYRPISLIHSLSKIFSKLLANRLAPILGNLISKNQSAFIKTRCIHDNFLYV
jgi:hypothetical protein